MTRWHSTPDSPHLSTSGLTTSSHGRIVSMAASRVYAAPLFIFWHSSLNFNLVYSKVSEGKWSEVKKVIILTIRMDSRVLSLYQSRMRCVLNDLFVSHDEPSPQPRVGLAEVVSELCKVQDEGRTQGWWNDAVMIWSKELKMLNGDKTLNPRPVPFYYITWHRIFKIKVHACLVLISSIALMWNSFIIPVP